METISTISEMGMENMRGGQVISIRANGRMERCMAEVCSKNQLVTCTKEISMMIRNMVKAAKDMLMGTFIMEIGKGISIMDRGLKISPTNRCI